MKLDDKVKIAIRALQNKYPVKRSALIPALHLAQSVHGYLPREIQNEIAVLFEIDPNEVNSVVTFYDMFYEEPIGKHVIHVCKNVSCMLRGSDEVLNGLCRRLSIQPGKTSQDGEFTVIASECLGACDKAPMMLVDEKVVGPVSEDQLDHIIETAKQGHGHPSPVNLEDCHG
jgi:NADH-quinone oxidoreductase subunit E